MKKIICSILAVAMIIATFTTTAFAAVGKNRGSNAQIESAVAAIKKAAETNYGINDMTKEEYLYLVRKFVPESTGVYVDLAPSGHLFSCKNSTADAEGKVSAQFTFYWNLKNERTQQYDLEFTDKITFKIPKLTGNLAPAAPTFTDVAADSWYAEAVKWAVEKGITSGTSETTFSPDMTCTKAQIITFLFRASGSLGTKIENPYDDVTESDYFYEAARWAFRNSIYSGNKGYFEGTTPCTRADVVTYIWNLNGKREAYKNVEFTDVPDNAAYAKAVYWAVKEGITSGTSDTTFSPDTTCTRAQIVTFLYRAFK